MRNEIVPPVPLRPILRLGSLAHSVLAPGARGSVLAATSSATYLSAGDQGLLWLTTEQASLHRRGMQVAGPLPRLSPGTGWAVVGRRLDLGHRESFDLSGATVWEADEACLESVLPLTRLPAYLSAVSPVLARLPSPVGFGLLLPAILARIEYRPSPRMIAEPAPSLRRAWPAIRDVRDACLADDLPGAFARAEQLVGLGEGLTPSGDDFVGGLLYCLQRLRRAHPSLGPLDPLDLHFFLQYAEPRTNLISYTLLRDHALGHACEVLHKFVDGLMAGQALEGMERSATRLIGVGHSTGWDLLCGVVVGLMSTCGALAPRLSDQAGLAQPLLS